MLSPKFHIVWLSACLSQSLITQSCPSHTKLSIILSFFKVRRNNLTVHFLQQGQISLQRWNGKCGYKYKVHGFQQQQIVEMVSMAWKISHLLLYLHKYTEDYLQYRGSETGRGWGVGGNPASFMDMHSRLDAISESSLSSLPTSTTPTAMLRIREEMLRG